MRGILLFMSQTGENGERLDYPLIEAISPWNDLDENQAPYGDTMEGVLALIKQRERDNVCFDQISATGEERELNLQKLDRIDALGWPSQPNS